MPMQQPPPAPFVLEGIDHVLLLVRGLRQAVKFYRDVPGCRVEGALPEHGMVNLDHVGIAVARYDEEELRRHLQAHGVKIVEEGMHAGARGNSLSIYIRDPSGNTIEIKGPPSTTNPDRLLPWR